MVQDAIQYEDNGCDQRTRRAQIRATHAESNGFASRLASPVDRAAAFVADTILFVPLMAVAAALFRKNLVQAHLTGQEDAYVAAQIGLGFACALSFVLYQTLFICMKGATPGKWVLGLRVESVWGGDRPRPLAAFIRSCAWCFEVLLLGIPLIAVYGNERRRPFHDRLADTVVVTVAGGRARPIGPPSLPELSIASGFYAAFLTFCVFLLLVHTGSRDSATLTESTIQRLEAEGVLCESVGRAEREWVPQSGEKKPSRLSVAVTLYAAEIIDEDCLRAEADMAFWHNDQNGLAYLAKGLAEDQVEGGSLSRKYLTRVCEISSSSDPCRTALLALSSDPGTEAGGPEGDLDEVEAKAAEIERFNRQEAILASIGPKSEPYLRVWALNLFAASNRWEHVHDLLDGMSSQREMGYFLASQRAKALWRLGRRVEARSSWRTSFDSFDSTERVEISRWFCFHEIEEDGCSSDTRQACDLLSASVDHETDLLADNTTARVYLRGESCAGRLTEARAQNLQAALVSDDAKKYARALGLLTAGKKSKAIEALQALRSGRKSGVWYFEASAKLADLASDERELELIKNAWLEDDSLEVGWVEVGRRLMNRFHEMQAWQHALDVGVKLSGAEADVDADAEIHTPDINRTRLMVIAAYHLGHRSMARTLLESLDRRELDLNSTSRTSASASLGSAADAYAGGKARAILSKNERGDERLAERLVDRPDELAEGRADDRPGGRAPASLKNDFDLIVRELASEIPNDFDVTVDGTFEGPTGGPVERQIENTGPRSGSGTVSGTAIGIDTGTSTSTSTGPNPGIDSRGRAVRAKGQTQ